MEEDKSSVWSFSWPIFSEDEITPSKDAEVCKINFEDSVRLDSKKSFSEGCNVTY